MSHIPSNTLVYATPEQARIASTVKVSLNIRTGTNGIPEYMKTYYRLKYRIGTEGEYTPYKEPFTLPVGSQTIEAEVDLMNVMDDETVPETYQMTVCSYEVI